MAIPGPLEVARRAGSAECPACFIEELLKDAARKGAIAKSSAIRKSPAVRKVYAHKCGKAEQ